MIHRLRRLCHHKKLLKWNKIKIIKAVSMLRETPCIHYIHYVRIGIIEFVSMFVDHATKSGCSRVPILPKGYTYPHNPGILSTYSL